MKKETVDEIVGRALRGEPYVPTGDEDVLVSAQPAAPQGVAYADAHGAIMGAAYDFLDAHISGSPNQKCSAHAALESAVTHALRASNGQAPAGASKFADVIAVQRSEAESDPSDAYMVGLYNGMSMMDANYRNITDWEPMGTVPKPTPTAQAAPAAGAVAGMPPGISALMCVISSLRDTAHFSDEEGELTDELRTLRDWAMTQAAAPTPAAQADSQPAPVAAHVVADALADSQYLAGVSAGWNAANADDPNAALQKLHESRAGYLKPLSAARDPADSVLEDAARLEALHAAVTAIYFDDSSDFKSALGAVVRHLDPKLAGDLLAWPKRAYDISQARLDAARKQGGTHDNH